MAPCMPREHALWGWVGIPLFAAFLACPTPAVLAASAATFAAFGAFNAAGRAQRGSLSAWWWAGGAAVVAVGVGFAALALAERPSVLAGAFLVAGASAVAVSAVTSGRLRQDPGREALVVLGLCGHAGAVGVAGGADPLGLCALLAVVLAWLWLGLWWINGVLSPHLPNRTRWTTGPVAVVAAVAGSVALGIAAGPAWAGLLPVLYVARIAAAPAVSGARDARRIGLTELGWGTAIAAIAALAR